MTTELYPADVEAIATNQDQREQQIKQEKLLTEFFKMFIMGAVTGKSRKDTFQYNNQTAIEYINGIEFVTGLINEESFDLLPVVKNNALLVVLGKSISSGFNKALYPDIINEYVDINDLDKYENNTALNILGMMLADIVMGNAKLIPEDVKETYKDWVDVFEQLNVRYRANLVGDVILSEDKKVIV